MIQVVDRKLPATGLIEPPNESHLADRPGRAWEIGLLPARAAIMSLQPAHRTRLHVLRTAATAGIRPRNPA